MSVYLPESLRRQLHKMGRTAQAREAAGTYAAGLNRYLLMNLHSALAENLLLHPSDEGRVRQHAVDIGKSMHRPLSTPPQINETLDALLLKLNAIADPFEPLFFAMPWSCRNCVVCMKGCWRVTGGGRLSWRPGKQRSSYSEFRRCLAPVLRITAAF